MRLRLLTALLVSMISTQSFALNVDCKVEVDGKVAESGVHKLEQIPDEAEGAAVGIIYQDSRAQIVVSNYPLQVSINELFGGHVIRSTESSRIVGLVRMVVLENRVSTAIRIQDVLYRVSCAK